ncbi:MAG TPA: lactate utilization protein LutB domain-containing protein, partial [Blastocatellia bacterium]
CPVYQKIGGHAYGWIYPGPIGSVITPELVGLERAAKLPFASSLCGACREACPIKINIPDMLLELRHEVKEGPQGLVHLQGMSGAARSMSPSRDKGSEKSLWDKLAGSITSLAERTAFKMWALAMSTPERYNHAARFGRLVSESLGDSERGLPAPAWTRTRNLPPLAPRSFRELWPDLAHKVSQSANSGSGK